MSFLFAVPLMCLQKDPCMFIKMAEAVERRSSVKNLPIWLRGTNIASGTMCKSQLHSWSAAAFCEVTRCTGVRLHPSLVSLRLKSCKGILLPEVSQSYPAMRTACSVLEWVVLEWDISLEEWRGGEAYWLGGHGPSVWKQLGNTLGSSIWLTQPFYKHLPSIASVQS